MLSTVSLIDPTTLNPSFSGPDTSRMGRPAVIITRQDQQASVDMFQLLLTNAKAYRIQMLALSKAAANFGYALEKIAHSKAAVRDPTNVCSSLQAAAGLHYLMSNHHQILSDTLYKQFEIPLLQHLDTHKANIEASEAQYERSMREMSQKIKETEATSMQNGRKRQRGKCYLLQFRQALTTLTMQVDELERIKLGYYFGTLESEQSNLQLILQKTSTVVRAEVDIYERIAQKGLNDLILEPMTTQGPDPYCTYPTTDEFSSIFSILPPTPIIPTSGSAAGATGTSTPQPEAIMSNFYGYHEANPFSTARNQTNATPRDRHLFGEASSSESKESLMTKAAVLTAAVAVAANAAQAATSEANKSAKEATTPPTTLEHGTLPQDPSSDPSSANVPNEHSAEGKESNTRSPTPELGVKSLAVGHSSKAPKTDSEGPQESISDIETVNPEKEASASDPSTKALDVNVASQDASESDNQNPPSSSNGVDMPRGEQHHRSQETSRQTEDGSHPASSVGEQASSEQSDSAPAHSIRSQSGSRSLRMFSSTPDSPPVRGMIHIGQDSELLNNRDFSFSYEPTELLEQRSHHHHHSQLGLSRHGNGVQEFGGFATMEEEEGGFGATPPTTHQQSTIQHKSSNSDIGHELRHRSSDGQLSRSSSSNLSSLASSGSAGSLHHRRSLGRIRTDQDGTSHGAVFGTSLEEPLLQSAKQQVEVADHIRELGRGFDDGMPAFFADEEDEPETVVQPRYSHQGVYGSGHVSRRTSGSDQDRDLMRSRLRESNQSVESIIRMADGSSKNVSTTQVNEITA
ncbi:hypothetical protein KVV02_001547 [Mortierella alpina]|uniref:IMD domain-containing protein n=1 Tax=Mortierella alpina TaxID=64518 RepID=A0A9P8CXG5_MORAP|nr:hypothetical protein KVV02_001547 [Mortierella alpina]